jgi:hypothetical protein
VVGVTPASPPWWAVLPPAQAQVSCGAGTHRLCWAEGRLTAADHPDAEGELVLAALGGERSECMDLVEAWGSRGDDLEILAVGPRSAADELTITAEDVAEMPPGGGFLGLARLSPASPGLTARAMSALPLPPAMRWPPRLQGSSVAYKGVLPGSAHLRAAGIRRSRISRSFGYSVSRGSVARVHFASGPAHRIRPGRRVAAGGTERAAARRHELLSLLALGAEFQMRLSATVAAAWADGGSRAGDRAAGRPALVAALTGRLAPAAQSWLGIDPGQVDAVLHEDRGWGQLALSGTGSGRRLRAALPVGWLASVWAAGLAVTAGHLIVEVREAAWPEAVVLGVPEPGAEPVTLKVRAEGDGWKVTTAGGNGAEGRR